jgi:hypothetical protein
MRNARRGRLKRVGERIVRNLRSSRTINLIVLGCTRPALFPGETPAGYEFSGAPEEEIREITACSSRTRSAGAYSTTLFRQFFRAGHRCVVARSQGRVVGHLWAFAGEYVVTVDDYRYTQLKIALDRMSVFTGNGYVDPHHRDHGVFRRLKLYLMHQYPAGTNFYAWVDESNAASLAANRALGFEPMAVLRFNGSPSRRQLTLHHLGGDQWIDLQRPWPTLRIAGLDVFPDS